jgi:IclR family acetate operon transcriptional repressor
MTRPYKQATSGPTVEPPAQISNPGMPNGNSPAVGFEEPAPSTAAERTLRVLRAIAAAGNAISLAELSTSLDLPKATVHRICAGLLQSGFLSRDPDERNFVVGPALRTLALDTLNHDSTRGLRHEVLSALVDQVGETCNFTTLDRGSVLYLDRVEAPWPWRLTLEVGTHVPMHCTASGKLFLALMPASQRETFLKHLPLTRLTHATRTTVEALRSECDRIARAGYSIDEEEFVQGLTAIAVPVRDAEGHVRAALAAHAPSSRMDRETALAKLPALRHASERMRTLL